MAKKAETLDSTIIHERNIENIFSEAFGRYAKYIIQDRALPDIRDGLKPVQRRIIYAMNDLGITHNSEYKKSARTVGEVIGKYHPHGDTSIYDAMVRMSQDWKNNVPLIDMHGNNGSIDNDPAAAMRYTESRLSSYAEKLICDIKKKTVPFIENFDGSEEEPTVLPSLMPNLLINGASGIAAGYATNIPPFNPNELLDALIKRIDSPECRIDSILKIMPGPDFPTGGIILGQEQMKNIYETGRGKIFIRSKIELEGKKQAYITQIPYEVNKAELIDEINDCAEKFEALNIIDCHDETDASGLSICINFRNTDNFEFVKNFLFKNTSLQISYNFNMIAIKDRKPCMFSIPLYLDSFNEHSEVIVLNSTKHDLAEVKKRKEIVEGLIKAISVIDQIIAIIRKSANKSDSKEKLIKAFNFTEIQAEAIVSLRLYTLSNSDVTALQLELVELNKLIIEYTKIINDKNYRNQHIKEIYKTYKKMFKCERKTEFSNEIINTVKIATDEIVEDKDVCFVFTKDGYIKNVPEKSYTSCTYKEIGLKESDGPVFQIKTSQKNKIIFITNKGNYFATPIHTIESTMWKDEGIHVNRIVELGQDEKVFTAFVFNDNENKVAVLATKGSMIKRTLVSDLSITRINKLSTIMKIDDKDEVIGCLLADNTDISTMVGVVSDSGYAIMYPLNQIGLIGKNGAGVKNVKTDEDVACIFLDDPTKSFVVIGTNQGLKKIKKESIFIGNRGNKGKKTIASSGRMHVQKAFVANNVDEFTIIYDDKPVLTQVKDVIIGDENTKVTPLRASHKILAISTLTQSFDKQQFSTDQDDELSLFK